jgi:pyruvate/2-oxoglutarate dehydrogenase complex dihydrolipoamide dehydrogenase (E3) component
VIPKTSSENDQRLLKTLLPEGWRNPEPPARYHLVVVGGGTAGLVTAAVAAALGARTALVERGLMGGDCLNFGCVPSKALLASARSWYNAARVMETFGSGASLDNERGFLAAMERMRRLRADISVHDSPGRFRGLGVDVWLGEAVFAGRDVVRVGESELRFRRAVIATGTRPYVPRIDGVDAAVPLTNETIFDLERLPGRLVIVGGGPVGVELAQAFRRYGSQVAVLEETDRVLGADDPEAAAVVERALREEGVRITTGAAVSALEQTGSVKRVRYRSNGREEVADGDEVLFACGRVANVEGLGLEQAGVELDGTGGIRVDQRLRTSNPRIFAIGDVVGPYRFTHVADAHARLVVRNALFHGRSKVSDLVIPWCTYTSPELAHVGRPYDEVTTRGKDHERVTIPFADVDRARLDDETDGFLRIHLEAGSDRIVAATIVGANAGELASQLSVAMTAGLGLGSLANALYPYPTVSEVVRKAADAWNRKKLTPRAASALSAYFRLLGRK